MDKNPFSLYDFLGYVIPGSFAMFVVYFVVNLDETLTLKSFISTLGEIKGVINWESCLWIILLSYIIGHIVAYLSSLTIEPFSVWKYGYPSSFLLGQGRKYYDCHVTSKYKTSWDALWKSMVALFILPITFCSIFVGDMMRIKRYSLKELDSYLKDAIYLKLGSLLLKLNLQSTRNDDEDFDMHRIIYHYEYEKQGKHSVKMDNYVALYGFMRSITFISNCIFMYTLLYAIINAQYCILNILLLLLQMFLTYMLFLAFIKFYRRFTLESFMCLITDEDLHVDPSVITLSKGENGNIRINIKMKKE